jgi:hypothetical protein
MAIIRLPYGNNTFDSNVLTEHIISKGRNYIIQGKINCTRANHNKQNRLDCWLRDNYAENADIRQAVNEVIRNLVKTNKFMEDRFICPDSGRICKGIRIINNEMKT